jgi:hypothetical protein
MTKMNPSFRFILLISTITIICVLLFSSGYFDKVSMTMQGIAASLQMEKPAKASAGKDGKNTDALLVLSAAAFVGGGVLWTVVNFRKE